MEAQNPLKMLVVKLAISAGGRMTQSSGATDVIDEGTVIVVFVHGEVESLGKNACDYVSCPYCILTLYLSGIRMPHWKIFRALVLHVLVPVIAKCAFVETI